MLLRRPEHNTAPVDYLYARLRARRRRLGQGGRPEEKSGWQAWRQELGWVYDRLPPGLHRLLQPVFAFEELSQLHQALRALAAGDRPGVDCACRGSLLSAAVKDTLLRAGDLREALERLERHPVGGIDLFSGAWPCYLEAGPGGLENLFAQQLLLAGVKAGRGSVVAAYFRYRIDMRNLLGVAKHLRWQVAAAPVWLDGGELSRAAVWQAWLQKDLPRLGALARSLGGRPPATDADLETQLWQGLVARLRTWCSDPLQPGLVIDYLLRWQLLLRRRAAVRPVRGAEQR